MNNINKDLIKEDIEFINEYIDVLVDNLLMHPEVKELFEKMRRRLKDIESRKESV